ncbi:membrane progestin receptor delta [Sylvia atricapilla]|uniref:membrane progestin receptor delta n=1 Tax=Sylvia atricapilla TaxID=48155 RepID=UPI0033937E52
MLPIFWEDGIVVGYWHPKSSALHCVFSSFQMMNETVLDALPADQMGTPGPKAKDFATVLAVEADRGHIHQLFHICSVQGSPWQLEDIHCDVCRLGCGAS